jgi:hypothetical protein
MYKESHNTGWHDMMPEDIRALKAFVEKNRAADIPYDICVGGRARWEDWEKDRSHIRSVAEAGATWWLEFIEPTSLEKTYAGVRNGPLKIEE